MKILKRSSKFPNSVDDIAIIILMSLKFICIKLQKNMLGNLCGFMSSNPQPGTFAYQIFDKVPNIPLGGISQFVANGGNLQNFISNFSNIQGIANNIGTIGRLIGGNQGQGNSDIFSQFINNVPKQSIKGTDSNLKDLINDETEQGSIKKILKSNYSQLLQKYKKDGGKWTDNDFPPDQTSIGNIDDLPVKASWKRIPQVVRNAEFVSGKIQPSDVLQGSIGDCYFLSAISALAENDFRIKNLFPDLKMNPFGIYMVRILYQGILREVVVDDYVPVTPQNTPLFAKPAGGREIWVMILQKAWAKLHGSYGAIVGGLPNQVLHAFSGAPTFYSGVPSNKQKQQKLWLKIFKAYQTGSILCCGTKADPSIQKSGLVLGHAYTILDVYDNPARLLKLRNPWGKRQWNGRASEQDTQFWSKVPPALKQQMNLQQKNDGIFFILWEDFVNYFGMVDICNINDNANYLSVESDFKKKNGEMFEFETEGGIATVGISQQSLRGGSQEKQKKGYSRATIVVSKNDAASKGYEYKYIGSTSGRTFSDHYLQLPNLQPGKYIAFVKIDWISESSGQASFNIYSQGKTTLKKSKQSNHDKFLYKTFLDHARKNQKKQILNKNPLQWVCSDFLMSNGGYGYFSFHLDKDSKKKLGVQLKEKQFTDKRLTLKKPYKGQGQIKTMVEPGKQLIILYRMTSQNYPTSLTLPTPKIYNLT